MLGEVELQHVDVQFGSVPEYSAFVRHIWTAAPALMGPPPVMYRVLFECESEQAQTECRFLQRLVMRRSFARRVNYGKSLWWRRVEADVETYELCFGSLQALHRFLEMLAAAARMERSSVAAKIGEFMMWTLRFRWV